MKRIITKTKGLNLKQWLLIAGLSVSVVSTSYAVEDEFWLDVQNNKLGSVTKYLAQGVDPNIQSREKQPAIMWAIQNEAWRVYDLLRQHRAFDPNAANGLDETPLMYLAILGDMDRAQALIAQGAKINRLGWSPLHYAASKGQVPMAQMLIAKGALINAPAPDGTTPLMMAARSGSGKMVNLLLAQGADPTTLNIAKLSAADWAESNKEPRLAERLREVAAAYEQQRRQNQGEVKALLIDETIEQTPDSVDRAAQMQAGSSQYFDLKRFDEPVAP